jgi:hypothetical protein
VRRPVETPGRRLLGRTVSTKKFWSITRDDEDWQHTLDANLFAAVRLDRERNQGASAGTRRESNLRAWNGQVQVREPCEQSLQGDRELDPGQPGAQAKVDPAPNAMDTPPQRPRHPRFLALLRRRRIPPLCGDPPRTSTPMRRWGTLELTGVDSSARS